MVERHARSSPQAKFGGGSRPGRPWPRAANSVALRKHGTNHGAGPLQGFIDLIAYNRSWNFILIAYDRYLCVGFIGYNRSI
jgi:hypothetical protein